MNFLRPIVQPRSNIQAHCLKTMSLIKHNYCTTGGGLVASSSSSSSPPFAIMLLSREELGLAKGTISTPCPAMGSSKFSSQEVKQAKPNITKETIFINFIFHAFKMRRDPLHLMIIMTRANRKFCISAYCK
jgi:hypothetical protein